MLLLIDIGNTRLKWRLQKFAEACQGEVVARGGMATQELDLASLEAGLPDGVSQCWFTSVARQGVNDLLGTWGANRSLELQQAQTQSRWQDLVNSYADCSRMGVDRWLAMVAARQITKQPVCVIDCGSATTVDFIAADGRHEGGYIIPGQRLMVQSLLKDTANIAFASHEHEATIGYGTSTAGAVLKGAACMHEAGVGEIAVQALVQGYQVIAAGGDGGFLASNKRICYFDELVLDGLWACLYHMPG